MRVPRVPGRATIGVTWERGSCRGLQGSTAGAHARAIGRWRCPSSWLLWQWCGSAVLAAGVLRPLRGFPGQEQAAGNAGEGGSSLRHPNRRWHGVGARPRGVRRCRRRLRLAVRHVLGVGIDSGGGGGGCQRTQWNCRAVSALRIWNHALLCGRLGRRSLQGFAGQQMRALRGGASILLQLGGRVGLASHARRGRVAAVTAPRRGGVARSAGCSGIGL